MRRVWSVLAVLTLLLLAGCTNFITGGGNPETDRYYQGSEGIRMRFIPGTPPPRLFYYLNPTNPDDNTFEVAVELKNEGASDAIGATYISGYSPDLVRFQNVEIQRTGISDCTFDFSSFGGNNDFQFAFSCAGVDGNYGGASDWSVRINEVGQLLGIDELEGWNSIGVSQTGDDWGLNFGWDTWGSVDVMNHGRAMVLVLSSIDFRNYNGFPFNGGLDKEGPGVLRGDNHFYPGGDLGFQNFVGEISPDWPAGLDETDVTFLVTACYGYATYAAPTICIDPAPYDETRKVCSPYQSALSGTQGAPVAITNMDQDPTPRKTYLTFTIRNVGQGKVFNMGYLERCSPYFPGRMDSRHTDVVHIGDVRIGSQRLRCTPGYEVRLNNGVGTFTCEYSLEYATAKSAYETPVVIELWYGYQQSIQTTTHIKRAA